MSIPVEPVEMDSALTQAHRLLKQFQDTIAAGHPGPGDLHRAVEGAHQVTLALADLVATLSDAAPVVFATGDREQLAHELNADLRAMRGCLTTAAALVTPSLQGLRRAAGPIQPEAQR